MHKRLICLCVVVFGFSGCFNVEAVKTKLKTTTAQLDVATKRSNEIVQKFIADPASVTVAEKVELTSYLRNIRKVTIGLNVIVGNYKFIPAIKMLYNEKVFTTDDLWKLLELGKVTQAQYNAIIGK